jgi:peptidyl-tRNA hydrolase
MAAISQLANRDGDRLVISLDERVEPWLCGRFTKICVSVNSEAELLAVHEKARVDQITGELPLL